MKKKFKWNKDYAWTFTTYFTEGFPYAVIRSVSSIFLRDMKAPLSFVGMTSLFGIPWMLKFLWGPWVDEYSTKRRWMIGMQGPLAFMIVLAVVFAPLPNNIYLIYMLFFIGAFFAATNDTAIDGYYMDVLDKEGQVKFVGYRNMAYRLAWMTGTGVIVKIGTSWGWTMAFSFSAVVFGLFFLYHLFFLKEIQTPQKKIKLLLVRLTRIETAASLFFVILLIAAITYFPRSLVYARLAKRLPILMKMGYAHWIGLLLLLSMALAWIFRSRIKGLLLRNPDSTYSKAFLVFIDKEKIGIVIAFFMLLRVGEWTLANMVGPFIVDVGIKKHYGWLSAGVGLPASVVGALVGGWLISRYSLKKMTWPFIIIQNITNLLYMGLAIHLASFVKLNTGAETPVDIGVNNIIAVAFTHGFDQFAGGLGSIMLMTYLMRLCHKDYKAAHYSIGAALWSIPAPFAGVFSGITAEWLGFSWVFGISFILSIPGMLLIPFLPYLSDNEKLPGAAVC